MSHRILLSGCLLTIGLAACSGAEAGPVGPEPTRPPSEIVGDIVAGAAAFRVSCTECHTTPDAFDLAHFDYPPRDVIRRALGHVDSATTMDIAAYVESLDVPTATPRVSPFQPAGQVGRSDLEFWVDAFGTEVWPQGLTVAALRAIDPTTLAVPLALPLWSHEGSDEDWLPDRPMPARLLDHDGGALRTAVADYYSAPSEARLAAALESFHASSKDIHGICSETDPYPCFNARRWMSTLAGQHYLRNGVPASVPVEVAQVWWDVGESAIALQAVATSARDRERAFRIGSRWMYLGYAYAPEAFEEPAGYMGTFLIGAYDLRRVVTFAALRRMVGNGRAHRSNPEQFFHDGKLAAQRAYGDVKLGVTEFVLGHFLDRLTVDGRDPDLDLGQARFLVTEAWQAARGSMWRDAAQAARIDALRDQVIQLLQ